MPVNDDFCRDDFAPTASWANLRLRAELLRRLRDFFADRNFLEVETPLLSAETVVERHIDPLRATLPHDPRRPDIGRTMWLATSPEQSMKRLMAAGGQAIYQVTRAFRAGERGPLHNPEFTIVEWYRRDDTMESGMQLLSDLCQALLQVEPADTSSYSDAFQTHVGVDPHTADVQTLREAARQHGIDPPSGLSGKDRDGWLDLLLVERVEPRLGQQRPTILYDYPVSQAALARVRDGSPPVAERFELYVHGIELANGYCELVDAGVLRQRFEETNAWRQADGKAALPEAHRLLAAMRHGLPSCTGVALGFDRLVMLAAGAKSLDEVIAFPIERA